ncbi:MAG: alpha-amylase family glycosyl hydrolase, partial [Bacteroidota bacterium]
MTPFMKCTLLILLTGWLAGCGKGPTPLRTLDGPWAFRADPSDVGSKENWARQTNDTVTWKTIKVPGAWEDLAPLANYDGIGWYRSTFSAVGIGEPWSLLFEGVDDDAVVWLNGTEIGSHVGYSDPFVVDAAGAAIPGENSLVVRVVDHSGPGGIFRPVRIIRTAEKEGYLRSSLAERPARRSEEWVRNAVIYEVYLRSFSKDGSFSAVEARLQELKDLGVTVLWFMPIHPVGELNRKGSLGSPYAVRDFYGFNFEFGSGEDFRSLVSSAHRMGMKVIIDLVANHTAWDSPMLLDHPEWYTSNDDGAIVAPNQDWSDVADLNYDRHELRKYMVAMMRHWVKEYDIDGFRCDVAEMVPTDFWETARRELERVKPVLMLSEGTLPEHHLNAFDLTYAWTVYDVLDPILRGQSPASIISETIQREAYRFPQGSLRLRFNT